MKRTEALPFFASFLICAGIFLGLLSGCSGSKIIQPNGLSFIKLGHEMPVVGTKNIKGHSVKDSLCEENDFRWRAAILKYPHGRVYLEEDFFSSGILNRIRVATPDLKLKNGLAVGQTVAHLKATVEDWYISPLPEYKLFEFYSDLLPGLHFVVDEPGHTLENLSPADNPLEGFRGDSKIVAIVLY